MTLPLIDERAGEVKEKIASIRYGGLKTLFYIVLLAVLLSILNFVLNPPTRIVDGEEILLLPPFLQPYEPVIKMVKPYLVYIQAALVFGLGYLAVNAVSGLVYTYLRRVTDHPTASVIRTITRISGIAILLSLSTSIFNVNPAAALTVGSFGGLVVGFATQTIFSNLVAGVFILLARPFTYGDTVTLAGQTGVVREIRIMHLVLETEDGARDVLIPSGTVITQIIQKRKPPAKRTPAKTLLTLETPPKSALIGSTVTFAGKLVEAATSNPVPGAAIKILERDIGRDDLLAQGTTESDGGFAVEWTARKVDPWDNTAEIVASFEGSGDYSRSESRKYVLVLEKKSP